MKSPFAKALTKHSYALGAPVKILCLGYVLGIIVWVFTKVWYLIPVGAIWHIFVKIKFEKDEYWIAYFVDAMREKTHLEP